MMMVNGSCVGVEVRHCERGMKRQRVSNGGGVIRQEEETCERGKKRQKISNELIGHCSFKILPLHKLDGNFYSGKAANLEKSCDVEADRQSSEKALRAAMLKCRFADTILKAAKTLQISNKLEEEELLKQSNELVICRQRQRKALESHNSSFFLKSTQTTQKFFFL